MTLKFLCDAHKQKLSQRPKKALQCWQNAFDYGQHLKRQNRCQEALPYLGCALEAAEIIINSRAMEPEPAYELFTLSASQLIESLKKLNRDDQLRDIYWRAIERLSQELNNHPEAKDAISPHLQTLYQLLQPSVTTADQHRGRAACIHHFLRSTLH